MTTFPEVREALTAEHTRPLTINFRRDGSCYLSMGDHTKGTHKAFDIAFDGRYPPDVADAAAIEASYNAAPAMLAHIDAQAAEIERLHAGIANSHKGIAARDAEIERLREAEDALRRALEIIAVGDASNPQKQAAEELMALGYWRDTPEARAALEQTK